MHLKCSVFPFEEAWENHTQGTIRWEEHPPSLTAGGSLPALAGKWTAECCKCVPWGRHSTLIHNPPVGATSTVHVRFNYLVHGET